MNAGGSKDRNESGCENRFEEEEAAAVRMEVKQLRRGDERETEAQILRPPPADPVTDVHQLKIWTCSRIIVPFQLCQNGKLYRLNYFSQSQ